MKVKNQEGRVEGNIGFAIVSVIDEAGPHEDEPYKDKKDTSIDSRTMNVNHQRSVSQDNVKSDFVECAIIDQTHNANYTQNETPENNSTNTRSIVETVQEFKKAKEDFRNRNVENMVFNFDTSSSQMDKVHHCNFLEINENLEWDRKPSSCLLLNKSLIKRSILTLIWLLYLVYVAYCLTISFGDEPSLRLLVFTLVGLFVVICPYVKNTIIYKKLKTISKYEQFRKGSRLRTVSQWVMYTVLAIGMVAYVTISVVISKNPKNLIPLAGIVVFILILVASSTNRSKINWHTVFLCFALQFVIAFVILRTSQGTYIVEWMSRRLSEYIQHTDAGARFIFGDSYRNFRFIFLVLPQIIFFIATISVLSHIGVIPFINYHVGSFLAYVSDTSVAEAMNAVANMFLGSTAAIYFIKDYVYAMSVSQIFCVLVNGLGSIAGTVMVIFIGFGIPGKYLIAASAMSAPASLASAKISMPVENDESKNRVIRDVESREQHNEIQRNAKSVILSKKKQRKRRKWEKQDKNIIQAFFNGAMRGLKIGTTITISLLMTTTVLEFFNNSVEWFGQRAGVNGLSFELILSYPTWPFAFLMGIDEQDCLRMSSLFAVRTLSNPTLPYIRLGEIMSNKHVYEEYASTYNDSYWKSDNIVLPQWNRTLNNGIFTNRTEIIGTYALCGFATVSAIGTQIGVFRVLYPELLPTITKQAFRALAVGTIASFFTACIAGLLYVD